MIPKLIFTVDDFEYDEDAGYSSDTIVYEAQTKFDEWFSKNVVEISQQIFVTDFELRHRRSILGESPDEEIKMRAARDNIHREMVDKKVFEVETRNNFGGQVTTVKVWVLKP